MVGACETPNQGCDCDKPGDVVDCGQVERVSGEYVSCSMGQRTCDDGKWGACIGDGIATLRIPAGQRRPLGLGKGTTCPDNPCDPYCRVVIDTPDDLGLPDGGAFTEDGGLQVVSTTTAGSGLCTSMIVTPSPQSLTVTGITPPGRGAPGLRGEYFVSFSATNGALLGTPAATATDSNIDFDWADRSPLTGIPSDHFAVRWTGTIVAPANDDYTLCTATDDGVRLWLDGDLVIDDWSVHPKTENCTSAVTWAAGSTHDVRMEYFEETGFANAQLLWKSPTIAEQAVPESVLFQDPPGHGQTVEGSAQFGVELSPPGCLSGTPRPAWTLDRLDIASIDTAGKVELISAVSGPIKVTAYLGNLSASGVVNVAVAVADNSAAPPGSVALFGNAATNADTARILYPYDQTVLPIGLRAPTLQWDPKGSPASAVKLSLAYPATGTSTFTWSAILPEGSPAKATIPQQIWKYFEQSAKGQAAKLTVQRVVGGAPKVAMARVVNFSTAPVRGKIYYTEYHRNGRQNEMVADPGSEDPARVAFGSTDGCPVCHTISANGKVFATSSRVGSYVNANGQTVPLSISSTLGGVSSVIADGSLSVIADFVSAPQRLNYTAGADDWRGFAWAPLTPDGQYALVANNFWGNTKQRLIGIDPVTRQVSIGSTMQSGGSGTGLLARYYSSLDYTGTAWKRFDPQVNFNLAASPGGLISADFSVKRIGQIQAYFSEAYRFEVVSTSTDTFSLMVDGITVSGAGPTTLVAIAPMTAGLLVPFELDQVNTSGNSNVQLFWSSPSTPRTLVPQSQLYPPATEPMHGANVTYANSSGGGNVTLVEPDIASDWQNHNPAPGVGTDNWTSTWDAYVESPYTGSVQLCIDGDDGVKLYLDGSNTALIDTTTANTNACGAAQSWTAADKHQVRIVHTEGSDKAKLILKYTYGPAAGTVTEVIPSVNLYPYTVPAPTNGLTATYYDSETFNGTLPASPTNQRAFQRVDPNIDFDWLDGRPNYSAITNDDMYSARWTGRINIDTSCAGLYQFQSNGNIDGGRLWIDGTRVMSRWDSGTLGGSIVLSAGMHDFKFDWYEGENNASARLQWDTPCDGVVGDNFVSIPNSAFTPNSSYARPTGYVVDGGDNGNDSNYWVWELPTSASPTPVDRTGASPGRWGLAGATMMVPSFSPDGSKLVFIDGDSAGGAGWRKGLSTFDFSQTRKLFQNRRLITSTWPRGDVMKWPIFESDSRSVIFQTTVPGDACCRKTDWTKYGYMGPTNYYEDPGRLWSIDTQATPPTPIELSQLNSGEQANDANKSYQPTMLPVAAGGYRWVVFTSTRPYGNTLNLPAVQRDFSDPSTYASASYQAMMPADAIQSQLWVAAIDDVASGKSDRSHPAFWLPSQNFATDAANGYINERAFWAIDACHVPGNGTGSSCEVDEDCCGGMLPDRTAACRLDTPIRNPATRHCQALPPANGCVAAGESCGAASDCCGGLVCVGAVCSLPPPVIGVAPQNYERVYHSDCPDGTKVVWRFFDWQTETPATDSRLEFFAETSADLNQFSTLPVAPNAIMSDTVVSLGWASGDPVTVWTGTAVEPLLRDKMLKSQEYLKITVRFMPNTEGNASPILKDWRQSYSCVPAE